MVEFGDQASKKKTKWNVQKRLEFIEFRLFWTARLNRKDLVDTFGISPQQASADISTYEQIAPRNLSYDAGQKSYFRSGEFVPALLGASTQRYLLQLVAIESGWMEYDETWFEERQAIEVTTLTKKRVDTNVLMNVLDAIRNERQLDMGYRSMTGSTASTRLVEPHALSYNSGRWYVRAWSSEHNDFRDYNLNRIHEATLGQPATIDRSLDFQWHHSIDLEIVPNPNLPEEKQAAVEYEYEMTDKCLKVNCRLSVSFYLMSEHNLDVADGVLPPVKQQIVLRNADEVVQAREVARKLSKDALKRYADAAET
ncbi:helix-turn-helix transcriptional regulator [Roseibium aggregatum]|uniref:WYL domain-containing protein n=1 Tax=Roseibium aggregatum TaxID=187304 RepID=A0A939EIM4_9HYPH|nr:WYL domain-containing protein [Roseibium aggregatum]MBN9673714.1 WYL domain-containing protein [Roseibium aggregatum]